MSIKGDVHNKTITLRNIYKPAKDINNKRNIDKFIDDLNPISSRLFEGNADNKLVGDFYSNVLKND